MAMAPGLCGGACRLIVATVSVLLGSSSTYATRLNPMQQVSSIHHHELTPAPANTTSTLPRLTPTTRSGYKSEASMYKNLYIIGDTHGDLNYLVRSLVATGRFDVDSKNAAVAWKSEQDNKDFEIVVLGDFMDRGVRSRECAQLLKRLQEHPGWGLHLTVLLGNHESMTLRNVLKYAGRNSSADKWHKRAREQDLRATHGEGFELMRWMRSLPVVYLAQGVLMAHGGLSSIVARIVHSNVELKAVCEESGPRCGAATVDFINSEARKFYEEVHQCIQSKAKWTLSSFLKDCNIDRPSILAMEKLHQPDWKVKKKSGGGVLWFRGYSAVKAGAGSEKACTDASEVGKHLGAEFMAVAHTTHKTITAYCLDKLPVFAVDTHYTDCAKNDECDFAVDELHRFHTDAIDPSKSNVPQALLIQTQKDDGLRIISKCFSMVGLEVTDACFTIRDDRK